MQDNCLPYLRYVLNWFYSSDTYPTYHWALLFPACRLSSWSPKAPQGNIANISQLSNLFTAVDAIPHIFDSCHLNADTCLRLPLLELVQHTRPQQLFGQDNFLPPSHFFKRNPSAKKLIGHDLFIFEPNTQTIRYRLPTETIRFRNTTITVLTLLKTKQLLLQNFLIVHLFVAPRIAQSTGSPPLIDLSSCITSLISTSDDPIVQTRFQHLSPASPQYYKSLIPQKLPPDLVVLPPTKWKFFWRLQIPFKARTVWYRLIHKKLPTKQILNRYILPLHPTLNCQICPAESVLLNHLLSTALLISPICVLSNLLSGTKSSPLFFLRDYFDNDILPFYISSSDSKYHQRHLYRLLRIQNCHCIKFLPVLFKVFGWPTGVLFLKMYNLFLPT
ncbi:hypothetical protein G6F18_006385 [Rhizopus arrhizus]|nr:hypothetical protein G6F20_006279 [Rhizopus arrhizus]KAG0834287.1 hypothetical protein G6F18_006385 [Rhizopus arrhizus]